MYILGINAYHGDAAAAIIKDGRIVAAVEEERFNRIKHCAGFPAESVRYCLQTAGIGIEKWPTSASRAILRRTCTRRFCLPRRGQRNKYGGRGSRQAAVATVEPGERVTGNGEGQNGSNGRKARPRNFRSGKGSTEQRREGS